jgi:Phospholipase_D-nuclease N-terminal
MRRLRFEAGWQSGYAADCKSVYAGSIPTSASINKETVSASLRFFYVCDLSCQAFVRAGGKVSAANGSGAGRSNKRNCSEALGTHTYELTVEDYMTDAISYLAIAVTVVVIALDLLAIISVFKSDRTVGVKALWAIGIALLPILGLVFWLVVGVRRQH